MNRFGYKNYTMVVIIVSLMTTNGCQNGMQQNSTIEARDQNNDGKNDKWVHKIGKTIKRVREDTNFDGHVNRWEFYNEKGELFRIEKDSNHDGNPDKWFFYTQRRGRERLVEEDLNYDGKVDKRFKDKKIVDPIKEKYVRRKLWIEQDTDYDGFIDKIEGDMNGAQELGLTFKVINQKPTLEISLEPQETK